MRSSDVSPILAAQIRRKRPDDQPFSMKRDEVPPKAEQMVGGNL
jgi:hypothetical protein